MHKIVTLICEYCNNDFTLTEINYRKREKTRLRTGYGHIVCSRRECRKKQRQDVIKLMHNKNKKNNTWKKNGDFRKGKTYEELWGEEKAQLTKEKVRQARLKQEDPRLHKIHTRSSKDKMSQSRKRFLENNPNYSKNHGKLLAQRYMNLPPEEKLQFSLRGHEIAMNMKRYTRHGKMLTWYGKEVWYESDYERVYFEMLNQEKIYWEKNTRLFVPYYDSKHECIKNTKPDVLIYSTNFEKLHTIVEIKPYDFLLNPKEKKSEYYQITKDKHDGLLGYCKLYNLQMLFITELDLPIENFSKDANLFNQRKNKAIRYEEKLHKLQNIHFFEREYFTAMRRFEVDGCISNTTPVSSSFVA